MACNPLNIWRPIPAGSTFKPTTTGDANAYNVTIFVTKNGTAAPPLRHDDIAGGTAAVPFAANDEYVFDVVLAIFNKPTQDITLDLQVVDGGGTPVPVSDSSGGTRPAQCTSTFNDPAQSPVLIKLIALA